MFLKNAWKPETTEPEKHQVSTYPQFAQVSVFTDWVYVGLPVHSAAERWVSLCL